MLQYKKKFLEKMGETNIQRLENLKNTIKNKEEVRVCQDIVNGTTYKQKKEKQMQQEEKYSQNQEENY